MHVHKAILKWGLNCRLLQSICSPHTYRLSQFLKFAVCSEFHCQLTLLCFHFATGFLFLSALTVTFSSAYFSASLMPSRFATWFCSPLLDFLGPVQIFISSSLYKQKSFLFKSTDGFKLSIDSKPCCQRTGEVWLCLPLTVRDEVSWHHAKHRGLGLITALFSISIQYICLLYIISFHSQIKKLNPAP